MKSALAHVSKTHPKVSTLVLLPFTLISVSKAPEKVIFFNSVGSTLYVPCNWTTPLARRGGGDKERG